MLETYLLCLLRNCDGIPLLYLRAMESVRVIDRVINILEEDMSE